MNANPSQAEPPSSHYLTETIQEVSERVQDEREWLIFHLLQVCKWFIIPTSVTYLWLLSDSDNRSAVYNFVMPTVVYIPSSLFIIIILWVLYNRIAENTEAKSYHLTASFFTIVSFTIDLMYILFLTFNQEGGNILWILFVLPMGLTLLVPRLRGYSQMVLDGVSAFVLLIAITGYLRSIETFETPSFIEGDMLICFSGLLFMWMALRMTRTWIDKNSEQFDTSLSLMSLWREVMRQYPADYFLVNEKGQVLMASDHTLQLLSLPGPGDMKWPERTESIRNALLLRFHAEKAIEDPITVPDDSLTTPVKIYPTFFGYEKQRYCIAMVQEESPELGTKVGLLRSDRLAIAGQIAAGLAHELGNPLGVIQSCASYLKQKAEESDPNIEEYALIETESKRCENLIDRLLSLASPKRDTPGVFDLRDVLNHAVSMVKYQATERHFDVVLPSQAVYIYANEGQISAVFVNLLLNALQSMDESPPDAQLRLHMNVRTDEAVVDVTDEGCGISSEELERIFDPFFTKKADGTGLGLSIVHQIITSIGGRIDVASHIGSGTTFTVRLPLYDGEVDLD